MFGTMPGVDVTALVIGVVLAALVIWGVLHFLRRSN